MTELIITKKFQEIAVGIETVIRSLIFSDDRLSVEDVDPRGSN